MSFIFGAGALPNPTTVSYWIIEGLQTNRCFFYHSTPSPVSICLCVSVWPCSGGGPIRRPPRITCSVQKLSNYCRGEKLYPSQRNVDLMCGEHKGDLRSWRLLDLVGTCHCKTAWGEKGTLHINSSPHVPPLLFPDLSGSQGFPCQTFYRKETPPDRIPLLLYKQRHCQAGRSALEWRKGSRAYVATVSQNIMRETGNYANFWVGTCRVFRPDSAGRVFYRVPEHGACHEVARWMQVL